MRLNGFDSDDLRVTCKADDRRATTVWLKLGGKQVTMAAKAASRPSSLADAVAALQGILSYVEKNVTA